MTQVDALEERVLETVLNEVRSNTLKMPSLPEVAMKVRAAAGEPDVSVERLAMEIARDAALAARIIRVANSPLIRARAEVKSLPQALLRLGLDYVRDLVTAFAIEGAFEPRNPIIRKVLNQTWARSKETAAVSSALARLSHCVPPEQALLAGLVHAIGSLPLLVALDQHAGLNLNPVLLDTMVDEIHGDLGGTVLRTWRFPEELARVPEQYRDPWREGEGKADLSDVVAIAHLLTRYADDPAVQMPEMLSMNSARRLGLESVSDLLAGLAASEESRQSRSLLS